MSISLIQRLFGHELAEADHEPLQRGEVHRLAAAHALQRMINLRGFHHAAGERGVERRQGQCLVLENLDELAAHAEQEHRSKLRINAAAQDDFVAFAQLDHLLDRDALEMLRAGFLGARPS